MEIDVNKILANHIRDMEQAEYQDNVARSDLKSLMERAFIDPDAARHRMDDYARSQGREALYEKLGEKNVIRFGRRPGSILSGDAVYPGADQHRRDADLARQGLPDAFRKADESYARLEQTRRAYREARERYGLPAAPPAPGRTPGPTDGKKNAAGTSPDRDTAQPAENAPTRLAPTMQRQEPPRSSQRPPRFSEAARGLPDAPIAFHQPRPGDKPHAVRQGFKPQQPELSPSAEGKPRSFSETLRKNAPDIPQRSRSFSNKLAQMREKSPESKKSQEKGRQALERDEDLER